MTVASPDPIPLALATRELAAITAGGTVPSYKTLYSRVLDGLLPAKKIGGRWYIYRADLAPIAHAFGLTVISQQSARRRSSMAPVRSVAA